jgi:hypothetical protein
MLNGRRQSRSGIEWAHPNRLCQAADVLVGASWSSSPL